MLGKGTKAKKPTRVRPSKKRSDDEGKGYAVENSLAFVARKFVQRLKAHDEMDLNEASGALGISKRRVYDITNVLEGMGLLTKTAKNKVRWDASAYLPQQSSKPQARIIAENRIKELQNDLKNLQNQCRKLESDNKELCSEHNMQHLFVTHDDLYSIQELRSQILIALRAPYGSTVEVSPLEMYITAPPMSDGNVDIVPLFFPEDECEADEIIHQVEQSTPIQQLLRLASEGQ